MFLRLHECEGLLNTYPVPLGTELSTLNNALLVRRLRSLSGLSAKVFTKTVKPEKGEPYSVAKEIVKSLQEEVEEKEKS